MNLKPEQLEAALRKGLQPVYLLCGDEPLQLMESADLIRRVARQQGYAEREIHDIDGQFNWEDLLGSSRMASLFSRLRVIELRIGQGKLGEKGEPALLALVQQPPADTLLLLIAGKLEKSSQNSKWYKTIEASGVLLQVWPLDAKQLPGWILRRAQSRGVSLRPEAAQLLAEGCEGNLLAAAQEIDKLHLLFPDSVISEQQLLLVVADNARYDLFGLVDACLAADGRRANRMLTGLRGEGQEPVLLLWGFCREIRGLLGMLRRMEQGVSLPQVLAEARVWSKRQALISGALRRLSVAQCERLLLDAGHIDRLIKGIAIGNVWDQLLQLALVLAGIKRVGFKKDS